MSFSGNTEIPFYFLDELVLRTPALPFTTLLTEEKISSLLKDADFLEAVYLASPVLYKECIRLNNGELQDVKEIRKIRVSLSKYYQRMYSRCTPFALFSGCSLVKWCNGATKIVLPSDDFMRSTRLDMHYLCAVGQHICALPEIKSRLLYFLNNSAYRMGDELRYIEYRYISGKRHHQISSVLYSEYLDAVIRKTNGGASIAEIINLLIENENVSEEEATLFADELIHSQVLISEMDPAITGDEFIHQLLAVLKKINIPVSDFITGIIYQLEHIVLLLAEIDNQFHNSATIYQSVIESIQKLGIQFEEHKLLQTDMFSRPAKNEVNEAVKSELLQAITILGKLFSYTTNENLSSFAERFRKRYEDQAIPLLLALDAETGIGYTEQTGNNLSPLLENLKVPIRNSADSYEIKWNKTEQWLFDKLLKSFNEREIVIDEKELTAFATDFSKFPPSLSVMFSLVEGGKIIFKSCSGSSAANLLGRFAHADETINKLVKRITHQEQLVNENILFAEIIHLPEDRVGNILLHPAFREYEIPFLAQSSLLPENRIQLQDIVVSVTQDKQIRLFSTKLNKEIIPRLSSAHNYSYGALPVYQFLAEMQSQGFINGLAYSWGSMSRHFNYLPRISYGNVILFEATWQLHKKDFQQLIIAPDNNKEILALFRQQWQLPRYVVLVDGDNELLVDMESVVSVDTFINTIKRRESIMLKEFLLPAAGVVMDEEDKPYSNQFIAVLMNKQQVYSSFELPVFSNDRSTRKFLPGTEWLYYKIYCGSKTADEILSQCIQPVTEKLLQLKLIDKWFFIRYNDPDFHLRLRIHICNAGTMGQVMEIFLNYIKQMDEEGFITKLQTDTYLREMERYGSTLMEQAEQLFFIDSTIKLDFLQLTEGDEREKFRWLWGLRGVDELLTAFGYSLTNKYDLMHSLKEAFSKEINADKAMFRQLNQQYNDNRQLIHGVMDNTAVATNEMQPLLSIYEKNKERLKNTAIQILNKIGSDNKMETLNNLLSSYIHMNLNRLFLSEPRLHEMIMYDFLCSYYRSIIKKSIN